MWRSLLYGPAASFPSFLLIVALVWALAWKGVALWKAARNSQKYWFSALLIVNTVGLLEIIYLAFFQKKARK